MTCSFSPHQRSGEFVVQQRVLGQQKEVCILHILPWEKDCYKKHKSFFHYSPTHVEPVSCLIISAVKLISAESGEAWHHLSQVIIIIVKLRVLSQLPLHLHSLNSDPLFYHMVQLVHHSLTHHHIISI